MTLSASTSRPGASEMTIIASKLTLLASMIRQKAPPLTLRMSTGRKIGFRGLISGLFLKQIAMNQRVAMVAMTSGMAAELRKGGHWECPRCNVTRYLVGGVTVRVRAHRPRFGGLVPGISAFKLECGVLLLGPLARLMGLRASGTFPCLSAPHFRDFQPPGQSRSALPTVTPP